MGWQKSAEAIVASAVGEGLNMMTRWQFELRGYDAAEN
jgi:hypothetical protein